MRFHFTVCAIFSGCKKDSRVEDLAQSIEGYMGCQQYVPGSDARPTGNLMPDDDPDEECLLDNEPIDAGNTNVRVFFIRHSDADWRPKIDTMRNQIPGIRPTHKQDAMLTSGGLARAIELRDWIFSDKCNESIGQCFLAGNPQTAADAKRRVVFAVSNLRRAIMTALIAFEKRLPGTADDDYLKIRKIHMLSSLGEKSSNVDSQPLTPAGHIPYFSYDSGSCSLNQSNMRRLFQTQCSVDEKPKLHEFCFWMRKQINVNQPSADMRSKHGERITDFVIVGHSIWIRKFFNKFHTSNQADETASSIKSSFSKLTNTGIVKFELHLPEDAGCEIVPETTRIIRGEMKTKILG